jgi:hypothetical protein
MKNTDIHKTLYNFSVFERLIFARQASLVTETVFQTIYFSSWNHTDTSKFLKITELRE